MSTVRDLSRNKTVSANFNLLFEGQGGQTQDKRDTTQDEKDIVGTKGTKRGHSGKRRQTGHFSVVFLFRRFSRLACKSQKCGPLGENVAL